VKTRVCSVAEIPVDGMAAFEVDEHKVLIAHIKGEYLAVQGVCTHLPSPLIYGTIDHEKCTIECAVHQAVFSLRTGEVLEHPATQPLATYEVTIEGDSIYLDLPSPRQIRSWLVDTRRIESRPLGVVFYDKVPS
jgi:3-phenylpropionate/trans-cinnamate dioxygenase ferredoxin subunit